MERQNESITSTIFINGYNAITPLGFSLKDTWEALLMGQTAIKQARPFPNLPPFFSAMIEKENLKANFPEIPEDFSHLERMIIAALLPLIQKHKISERTALFISTTKGNIDEIKQKETPPRDAFLWSTAQKIATFLGIKTKPIVISHACVSGVLAVSVAKNCLQSDLFDDAFIVGADVLSEFVVSGFQSFQAMSEAPCMPYDAHRSGINLGEASAAIYLSKERKNNIDWEILGESSINDANHISGPSRTGEGLFLSISRALKEAKISPKDIDFISAHGTATRYNDDMESIAFHRVELSETPLNSLKSYFGHTLGASGILELTIALQSSKENTLVPTKNYTTQGTTMPLNIVQKLEQKPITIFLKTASGFGGSNAAIVVKKVEKQ